MVGLGYVSPEVPHNSRLQRTVRDKVPRYRRITPPLNRDVRRQMNLFAKVRRAAAKLRFRLLGLATIKDISTPRLKTLLVHLTEAGWKKVYEYEGFDAWIDYGRIDLKRSGVRLRLEWDNWTEGSLEGPREVVHAIANAQGLTVVDEWRWSDYDERLRPNSSLERTRGR
jgi:hypothetical protein